VRDFTASFDCLSRKHCKTCRDREGGRQWRESMGAPKGECPHGVPWGFVPIRILRCAFCGGPHETRDCPRRFDETETKLIAEIDKRPEGLGDSVKSLIESLGLARAHAFYLKVRGLPAKNCQKCEDRRQWLNRFWPYH
jgi:hypothetical protein